MSAYIIEGGHPLDGSVRIHGAKNSVLPILAACLLAPGECVIHNCPELSDVAASLDILRHLGCRAERQGDAVVVDAFASDRVLQKIDEVNQKARMNATAKKPFKPIEISDTGLELIEYLSLDCTAAQGEWYSDSEIKIDKNGFVIRNGEKTKDFWDGTIRSEGKPLRLKIRNICGDETVWEV